LDDKFYIKKEKFLKERDNKIAIIDEELRILR